ncbi:hypothetical protein IQ264_30635 [Phormidium sp. LEGE 05292]|uniref:hypothetical protein n=1 Tax=[Phormidium] sp. LEGE 05292 TaxID=767427 RepID=UPI00187FCFDD|nr:hypothetical protein [Phormidium sp. LEGE 05292]MBE9229764.1 hypothetical protein [Phormidium sp. LEGE 05292]
MANLKPVMTEEFEKQKFKPYGSDEKLAKKAAFVKLPVDVMEELNSWPQAERVVFLRSLITNAVREKVRRAG